MQQIINDVKSKKLSYLSKTGLADIANAVKSIEDNSIEGLCIEAGCALGGSAIVIAKAKEQGRRFNVYDVFATIPPPTEKDGKDVLERYENIKEGKALGLGGDKYYGYENDLKKKVIDSIESFGIDLLKDNVNLIEGLFEDTLIVKEPVAFAHLDGDWYSSTITCLNQILPNLSSGGIILVDDYFGWSGARKAVNEKFGIKLGQVNSKTSIFEKDGYRFKKTEANKLYIEKV